MRALGLLFAFLAALLSSAATLAATGAWSALTLSTCPAPHVSLPDAPNGRIRMLPELGR